MRLLLTGGCGYIGSHTAWACEDDESTPWEVHLLDDLRNAAGPPPRRPGRRPPRFHRLDLSDGEALGQLFAAHRFDAVVHFAALKSVDESLAHPLDYYDNNVGGLVQLLRQMDRHGCRQLVFSSSATVYGDAPSPLAEDDPPGRLTTPYGRTKAMGEQILADLAAADPRWRIAVLRYFNPVGAHPSGALAERPRGRPANLMPCLLRALRSGEPFRIYGDDYPTPDGTCQRDYIHVMDVAEAHLAALCTLATAAGGVLTANLGTGRPHSVREVVRAVEAAAGRPVLTVQAPRRPGDCASVFAAAGRAERLLGWRSRRTLEDMCRDALRSCEAPCEQ
jgi:UDP-glucose 4-epimerase